MPVLDAKALSSDPEGVAFLRDVLRSAPPAAAHDSPQPTAQPLAPCQAAPAAKPLSSRDMLARLSRAPAKPEPATANHTS